MPNQTIVEFPETAEDLAVSISNLLNLYLEPPKGQALGITEPVEAQDHYSLKIYSLDKRFLVEVSDQTYVGKTEPKTPKADIIFAGVIAAIILFGTFIFVYGAANLAIILWRFLTSV